MREASLLFQGGVLLLPILSLALILGLGLSIPDGIFVAALVGTLPLMSIAQLPLLQAGEVERLPAYAGSVAMLLVLSVLGLGLGHLGPGLDAMGIAGDFGGSAWRLTWILAMAVAVLGLVIHLAGVWLGLEESPILKELIPRTRRERRLFAVLSLAAGFGEEVVYRGYLLAVLAPVFSGPWAAAVVSSLAFAVLHAYQGSVGLVRSGLLGFTFAAAFILGGSLWPLVLVHAGVDLISGLWLGPRMLESDNPGSPTSTDGE